MTLKHKRFFLLLTGLFLILVSKAQIIPPITTSDTVRIIQIVRADVFREKKIDSVTKLRILAGHVVVQDGTTLFNTDSAVINQATNVVDAYGSVHINQADSIHTYSRYLKYVGNERKAYLRKNVVLTDKKGKLTTDELIYDLATGIGVYKNGGKIVNKTTVLTSREGTYYSDTKDVYFRNNVHLVDPKYDITADSLQYNTLTEVANFTGPTYIKSKSATVFTTTGYYDLKQGKAFFGNRPLITDSAGRKYRANNIAIDEKTGISQLEGDAVVKDSAGGFTLTGGQIFNNSKNNSFLAMRKPVLIIEQENDSTYIAADTMFSGVRERTIENPTTKVSGNDSSKNTRPANTSNLAFRNKLDSIVNVNDSLSDYNDTSDVSVTIKDSVSTAPVAVTDTSRTNPSSDSSSTLAVMNKFSNRSITKVNTSNPSDTTIRFFVAFAHVRIFNDSLQAVCDSLAYSGEDSVFRMYKNPVAWSGQNQVTGDTLYMFTKNKKAERLSVFENAMMVNKTEKNYFNQISGRTLNGYFVNGKIDYMRSKGSPAESVYYVQDKDSAYVGMNRASGSVIDMFFVNQELKKVLFVNDVKGIMHPIRMIPEDQKQLKNFKWLDARRPKNRLELFE